MREKSTTRDQILWLQMCHHPYKFIISCHVISWLSSAVSNTVFLWISSARGWLILLTFVRAKDSSIDNCFCSRAKPLSLKLTWTLEVPAHDDGLVSDGLVSFWHFCLNGLVLFEMKDCSMIVRWRCGEIFPSSTLVPLFIYLFLTKKISFSSNVCGIFMLKKFQIKLAIMKSAKGNKQQMCRYISNDPVYSANVIFFIYTIHFSCFPYFSYKASSEQWGKSLSVPKTRP